MHIYMTWLAIALLTGCSTFNENGDQHNTPTRTLEQLQHPLSADDAVQLALHQNRFKATGHTSNLDRKALATETRKAYYEALAAKESVLYAKQIRQAAETGAELAKRMQTAGNFNALQQASEQKFYAQAKLDLARTEQDANAKLEKLIRLLGVGEQHTMVTLPDRLPDLPASPKALTSMEQIAPQAQSEVREAYQAYQTHYEIARQYRDEILPLQKRISQENQLRYNGMFIGVFDLLADAREQISSVNSAIEALRDFWIAQADLDMALMGNTHNKAQ